MLETILIQIHIYIFNTTFLVKLQYRDWSLRANTAIVSCYINICFAWKRTTNKNCLKNAVRFV